MSVAIPQLPTTETIVRPGVFRQLVGNPLAVVAMVYLAILLVVAILQPLLIHFPPNQVVPSLTNAPPFTGDYIFGGDRAGRDIYSRLVAGTRGGLMAGLVMTVVSMVVGIIGGLIAGYFGKVFDTVGNWLFSVLLSAPAIVILLALYTLVDVSMPVAMATLGVLTAPSIFYLVRTLTRNVRNELYVDAARVSGLSNIRIVGKHVLLAIKGPLIILASFLFGTAIAISAGLEFLGLGNPNEPSWGSMLSDAFDNLYVAPWQLLFPGLALGLTMAAFVLLGTALRDIIEGSFTKESRRARARRIGRLLGPAAVERTLGATRGRVTTGDPEPDDAAAPLLQVEGLEVVYAPGGRVRTVVEGASLTVNQGEIVGLVGESGSGKTQTVFATLGLLPEQAVVARGSVQLNGRELLGLTAKEIARYRGTEMAYIPQEPMSNLDPAFTIGNQLVEGIRAQSRTMSRADAKALALRMLERVGIRDPRRTFDAYPFEISGGMAQRVLIAGAVANAPRLLVADEPTTALDVTVQAEVLDLLRDLQRESGMGVLIVTHNLGVVADLCDRVVVMRTGRIVEEGTVAEVFSNPQHEYTQMLLGSVLDDAAARPELIDDDTEVGA